MWCVLDDLKNCFKKNKIFHTGSGVLPWEMEHISALKTSPSTWCVTNTYYFDGKRHLSHNQRQKHLFASSKQNFSMCFFFGLLRIDRYTQILLTLSWYHQSISVCVYLLTQKKWHGWKHRTRQVTSVCCSNSSCLLLVYFRSSFYLWLFMSHCVSQ